MITFITGIPGAGKTSHMVYLLVQKMIEDGLDDWRACKKEIGALNAGGFKNLEPPPQHHVCYSDFSCQFNRRFKSYFIDGFEIGLENPFFTTTFIPPYASIFLDEAQRYYDSRMSKYLREEVYQWYQLHRHNDYNIYMACQRLGNIDVNIRALGERFLVMEGIETKENSWGQITKIKWSMREFHSCDTAEAYMLARERNENKDLGEKKEIETELDIFDYYDSKSKKPVFYAGKTNRPFDYYMEEGYVFTLESFVNFNNEHYFTAPQGYWKNAEYDKMILKKKGLLYENYRI